MDDQKLDKIHNDVQDIKISLAKVEMTLERNTADVEKHIRRSDNYEDEMKKLKEEVLPVLPEIKQMIKYWKILSVLVILSVTSANPAIIPLVLKLFGVPVP
jgi:hypothetical protein